MNLLQTLLLNIRNCIFQEAKSQLTADNVQLKKDLTDQVNEQRILQEQAARTTDEQSAFLQVYMYSISKADLATGLMCSWSQYITVQSNITVT